MSIAINNNNGIIEVSQDGNVPRSYFGTSGKFYPSGKDENLNIDGFLINLEKDVYDVRWYDLVINGTSPTSLSDAQSLLASTFAGTPPTPPTNLTLKINNSSNFNIPADDGNHAGDFTIEWWAKMTADDNHPRPWSIGSYSTGAAHAVSIENGNFYYWVNGNIVASIDITGYSYIGEWTHFCVTRLYDSFGYFINGIYIGGNNLSFAIPTNGYPLYLGSEGNDSVQNGVMSNFRWNNTSVYPLAGFTPPSVPLTSISGTQLLIFQGTNLSQEITDNSGMGYTIINNSGIYNAANPFSGYSGSIQFGTL